MVTSLFILKSGMYILANYAVFFYFLAASVTVPIFVDMSNIVRGSAGLDDSIYNQCEY